jgi:hypothetical protein
MLTLDSTVLHPQPELPGLALLIQEQSANATRNRGVLR